MEAVNILIADDDPGEVDRIRTALRNVINETTVLTDREEVRDRILGRGRWSGERRRPDLAILDAQMMGEECYDLIAEADLGDTVVAVMDRFPTMEKVERARRAGVSAYAPKPLHLESLAEMLQDVRRISVAVVRGRSVEVKE